MAQFNNLQECLDYIEFLTARGRAIPQSVLDEKAHLEALEKVTDEEYIFTTMAAGNKFMTPEKEKVVREMTDQLMKEGDDAAQPCLLLGKVQCGKTDTFLSIMGLCFDRGIDIAVVMTKGTNTLTKQTIQRLKHDFGAFADAHTYNQKVVISVWDILDLYKRGGLSDYQLNDPANKFIIVCKKENTNLKDLIELFEENELLRSKKVLVCDDEADFASRAYYQRKGELTLQRIAEHIETFIKLPKYCRYLQITATPYSLYLQPDGTVQLRDGDEASPWLPRYTGLVPIHDKYIGGKQYYVDSQDENSMYSCLYQPVRQTCIDILAARNPWYLDSSVHSDNLDELNFAVVMYIFAAAVRSIQVRKKSNDKYYSSCLIHCEIAQQNHDWQEEIIIKIIEEIRHAFIHKGNTDLHILDLENDAYESLRLSNELGNKQGLIHEAFPSYAEIEAEVKRILERNDYVINVVNSEEPGKVATMLNEKGQLRLEQSLNIFIGGSILDRGITIDNMLCFFYGRDPKKYQMDTVLQHARMYGARDKEDMACTRFFTTPDIYDVLVKMNEFDEYLYDYLKAHRGSVRTDEFTSIVIGYDKRISPSAQNKYTPANTKVLKPCQRAYPVGFQTKEPAENSPIVGVIDQKLIDLQKKNKPDENGFFLASYSDAVELINLVRSQYVYCESYNNVGLEWDVNDMITPLDHLTFNTDGMILMAVRTDRNVGRERENIYDKHGRFIDAPEGGSEIIVDKEAAVDRPVLVLLRQNGSYEQGWRNTPFYWPVLTMPQNMQSGIFTINGNRKYRKPKKALKLPSIDKYPKEEILFLTITRDSLFNIISGEQPLESRMIKRTTASLFLEKDLMGNYVLVEGADLNNYYDLSTYNNGVFPYEVRKYKYMHIRASQDMSGSQALLKLNEDEMCFFEATPKQQVDVIYDAANEGSEAIDNSICDWKILYNIDEVLEYKFANDDEELYAQFLFELEEERRNASDPDE